MAVNARQTMHAELTRSKPGSRHVERIVVEPQFEITSMGARERIARIGTALALARLRKGLSSKALAAQAGIDPELLSTIELGDGECTDATSDAIDSACKVIGCSQNVLLALSLRLSNSVIKDASQAILEEVAR